jgi:hypothetical protein
LKGRAEVKITDVAWTRDHQGRHVLELRLDGHPVHIRTSQKTELTRRGLVDGVVFLDSERGSQLPNLYVQGDFAPEYEGMDLVGCTDDPEVFALYQEMCEAIRTDTWREGPRPLPVSVGHTAEPQE